jgi:adenine-specific DNA methylase
MVVVFANKSPEAWETLVSAIIKAGFVVDGSWPIQTEMTNRARALTSAALATSIWLVCKKRPPNARPGWDNKVLDEMRANIHTQLRTFWDAGIRGPDFVWAATGPALEAYSQYPVVKKANNPGEVMTVGEFLTQVRRMVVDFVVGRVLSGDGSEEIAGLDGVTTYYLLHRHDFGVSDAPAGPCILYAVSCGLADKDLADRYDILSRKGKSEVEIEEEETEQPNEAGEKSDSGGSLFRLKAWNQRKRPNMGYDSHLDRQPISPPGLLSTSGEGGGVEIPLIDQVHRIMQLWRGGDVSKVDEYLDLRGLRRSQLFHPLLQALIELAAEGSEERSILESISNHVSGQKQRSERLL